MTETTPQPLPEMIGDHEWDYCWLCEVPKIGCEHCGFGSCSGCGCVKCSTKFKFATECVNEGNHPPVESMAHYVEPEYRKNCRNKMLSTKWLELCEMIKSSSLLKDGWYEPNSIAPGKEFCDWLLWKLNKHHPGDPTPYPVVVPRTDGNLVLDYLINGVETTITIDRTIKSGYFHSFDHKTQDETVNETFDLNQNSEWDKLFKQI